MAHPSDLMTVPEVAAALRVGNGMVYRLISDKRIGAHRVGNIKGLRVSRTELDRFLADALIDVTGLSEAAS